MPSRELPALKSREAKITVRLSGDLIERLDRWIASQKSAVGRSEAVGRLAEMALDHVAVSSKPKKFSRGAEKAAGMAGDMIDCLGDHTATRDDREQRKTRLLKGPGEFREMRKKQDDARRRK